jgi:hypothetical protein
MKVDQVLDGILAVASTYLKEIAEAEALDCEVDAGGNSYNVTEAGGFFRAFIEEINDILPEDQRIEFPEVESNEDEDEADED